MKPIRFILTALCAALPKKKRPCALANEIPVMPGGQESMLTDAAHSSRWLLVKPGSDAYHVAIAGAGDAPIGCVPDEASAAEVNVTVYQFGLYPKGVQGIASGAIADGDFLVPTTGGKVLKLPTAPGTYYVIGRARGAAADGGSVGYVPCFPIKHIIT